MKVLESLVIFRRMEGPRILTSLRLMAREDFEDFAEMVLVDLGREDFGPTISEVADLIWSAVGGGSRPRRPSIGMSRSP